MSKSPIRAEHVEYIKSIIERIVTEYSGYGELRIVIKAGKITDIQSLTWKHFKERLDKPDNEDCQ